MNHYIHPQKSQFAAIQSLPDNQPLSMLNLLKFKRLELDEVDGKAAYKTYMKAAMPFIKAASATVIYYGKSLETFIGPENELEWDEILIVTYPTKHHFLNMLSHKDYPHHLRTAAIKDSRLVVCTS